MPSYSKTYTSPYNSIQLFDIVADVDKYPEFIPWIHNVNTVEKNNNEKEVEFLVKFKGFSVNYTSLVEFERPKTSANIGKIKVSLIKGPFRKMNNIWIFTPVDANKEIGCEVYFEIDFSFQSKMMEKMMGAMFEKATKKSVELFSERAEKLYEDSK